MIMIGFMGIWRVLWELEDKTQGHEVVGSVMTTFIHLLYYLVHNVSKR